MICSASRADLARIFLSLQQWAATVIFNVSVISLPYRVLVRGPSCVASVQYHPWPLKKMDRQYCFRTPGKYHVKCFA